MFCVERSDGPDQWVRELCFKTEFKAFVDARAKSLVSRNVCIDSCIKTRAVASRAKYSKSPKGRLSWMPMIDSLDNHLAKLGCESLPSLAHEKAPAHQAARNPSKTDVALSRGMGALDVV